MNSLALVSPTNIRQHSGLKDFEWAIELNRICFEFIGLWPKADEAHNDSLMSNIRMIASGTTLVSLCIIPLLHALERVWGDMLFMIDNLQITIPVLITLMRFVILRWKRSAFASIIKMMAEDWMKLNVDAERAVMLKWAGAARVVMICIYSLLMVMYPVMMILPYFGLTYRQSTNLTDGERLLPLPTYYLYDTDKSPQFELTYVSQMIAVSLCGIMYTSTDIFLVIAVFHTCGQLENFRCRLLDLLLSEDFDDALRNNVRDHLRLIRFIKNIEDVFSLMMLGLVLYFSTVFCLYGFMLLIVFSGDGMDETSISRKLFMMFGAAVLIWHTFLYCGIGEVLTEKYEAVYSAICEIEWYRLKPRNSKNLVLLMMLASEPCHITAGRIAPLTMATFCSLLKTSAGYISFLLAKRG